MTDKPFDSVAPLVTDINVTIYDFGFRLTFGEKHEGGTTWHQSVYVPREVIGSFVDLLQRVSNKKVDKLKKLKNQ